MTSLVIPSLCYQVHGELICFKINITLVFVCFTYKNIYCLCIIHCSGTQGINCVCVCVFVRARARAYVCQILQQPGAALRPQVTIAQSSMVTLRGQPHHRMFTPVVKHLSAGEEYNCERLRQFLECVCVCVCVGVCPCSFCLFSVCAYLVTASLPKQLLQQIKYRDVSASNET